MRTPSERHSEDRRPSPEALLRDAERADRSRLKIFVGAAPGVGKTYAMLQAAQERRREGADVVIGVVETHGRAETEALIAGIDVIPRRKVEYRGHTLEEMDLDAILARRPAIVLVDELAHTNAPGSRHPKRWSDVEELLDAGIEVYSTLNIQHLESLNDVVAQITGVRVRETVPDGILERADELKLIDLSPEDLIKRLTEGKVYVPPQAQRALENYFNHGNLTALRELALRHTAAHVDEEMRSYMRAHAVTGTWPVAERLMVCIRGGALGERMVRATRRMAARRQAEWIAVFVETTAFRHASDAEREALMRTLRLAEQLGGEPVTIAGQSVAPELVRYARERNVTELILGKSLRPWWRELVRRSPIAEVIHSSGDIDVRIMRGDAEAQARPATTRAPQARPRWARYAFALAMVAAAGAVSALLRAGADLADPAMAFLTGVLFTAVFAGLGPSIAAAVTSLLVYDFFFVNPVFTLTVTQPEDVLSLVVFLIVAVLTSHLTARARDQAELARQREARTGALYGFARQIAGAIGLDDLLPVVTAHLRELFHVPAAILMPEGERLLARARHPTDLTLPDADLAAATWVWRHDAAAGPGTDTLPGGEWLYVPLDTARGVVGVVGLRTGSTPLPLDQRDLLEAFARQTAVAIERTRIDVVLEEKAKTEAVIEAIEDGLIVLDPSGVVADINEVACAILEVERDDVRGVRFDDLASRHPHYLRLREAVRDLSANPDRQLDRVELTLFLRGRDHHYVLRPTPFSARDGSAAGTILTLQDVTYVRDQEARRENLVATLSHELRTPLTSLRMALELMRRDRDTLPAEHRALADAAHEDVIRLQEVSQQFLDLARSRAMTIALERGRIDVADLVGRVARLFDLQAREKQIALVTSLDEQGSVLGDEIKLTWALSNLVSNALRHSPAGGSVTISTAGAGEHVLVTVADTGAGIPQDQQARIFERFAQSAATGDIGAAGLGLAIVRDIVQAHGGRVHLDSAPGRGTRFTLELPRS